jgi:hypothetical protein
MTLGIVGGRTVVPNGLSCSAYEPSASCEPLAMLGHLDPWPRWVCGSSSKARMSASG